MAKQINFLTHQVFTDEWTDLERLTLVQYNQRAFEQTFTADNRAADVRQLLGEAKQQQRPSNISTLFSVLDFWQQQPAESPVHLLVFVSRIDQATVDESRLFVQSLQRKHYALTFVAVGGQLDSSLFYQLSPNLIHVCNNHSPGVYSIVDDAKRFNCNFLPASDVPGRSRDDVPASNDGPATHLLDFTHVLILLKRQHPHGVRANKERSR
ncbi:hypothetical protein M3Y99_01037300 [Aphelenchoides fujianensis]|nr:hypothetical protein M3Y99_01037300 [Aphelenchoides fujianensis]